MTNEQENMAAFGGRYATVHTRAGTSEQVLVKQLSIRQLPLLFETIDDEARALELYCDRPEGWADTLTPKSVEELLKLGEEANEAPFASWLRRRLGRQSQLKLQIADEVAKAVAKAKKGYPLADGSPASPQPAA